MTAEQARAVQREAAKHQGVPVTFTNALGMKMVYVPAGSFLMGLPRGEGMPDEGPQHRVTITKAFYLSIHEVTQEKYQKVMGVNPSRPKKAGNYPVGNVTWEDAVSFCKKLSAMEKRTYRLPSEAEWEYACRAGTTTTFWYGGDEADLANYAWYEANSKGAAHPVGQKKPNPWGLYDVHGNVWEWCRDWFAPDYYKRSPPSDPPGAAKGKKRIVRGGSWDFAPYYSWSGHRCRQVPTARERDIGLRVVSPIPPK